MKLNLKLANLTAEDGNARDARNAEQPGPHGPIDEGPHVHRAHAIGSQADNQRQAGCPDERSEGWRFHALRYRARSFAQTLRYHLPRAINICSVFKRDDHNREALDRIRADGGQVRGSGESVFDRTCVTSVSTSSAESPGASVCMVTCGGANSGYTSNFAFATECRCHRRRPDMRSRLPRRDAGSRAQRFSTALATVGPSGYCWSMSLLDLNSSERRLWAPVVTTRSPGEKPAATR